MTDSKNATRAAMAIGCVFFTFGAMTGSLAVHFASIKERLGAGQSEFAVALMLSAIGTIVGIGCASRIVKHLGSSKVVLAMGASSAILFAALFGTTSLLTATLVLFALGVASGGTDAAMNIHASMVEQRLGRPVMTRIHALYSVGGIFGAYTAGVSLNNFPPYVHSVSMALAMLTLFGIAYRFLLPATSDRGTPATGLALPRLSLLPLAGLAFLALFCAGAMRDWVSIYLTKDLGADYAIGGTGFAVYSAATAIGRLFGDTLRQSIGLKRMLIAGGLLGGAALAAGIALGTATSLIVSLALLGLAHANLIPLLFSAAGQAKDGDPAADIGAVMTIGLSGFIVGPPLIGFVADRAGLSNGLLCVAIASIALGALALKQTSAAAK